LWQRIVESAPSAIDEQPCPVVVPVWRMFILDTSNFDTGTCIGEQPRTCSIKRCAATKSNDMATLPIFIAFLQKLSAANPRLGSIEVALMSTGVVSGEFGMVDAYRQKKDAVATWLEDPRPKVRTFAERYRRMLDNRIATEQEDAERRRALRKLHFDGDEAA
jgi:hypothetical protein